MQKGVDDNTAFGAVRREQTAVFLAVRQRPCCAVQCLAVQMCPTRRFGNDRLSHLAED